MPAPKRIAFTVDVEDWYHGLTSTSRQRAEWDRFPRVVSDGVYWILDRLAQRGIIGTFFVLGVVAKENPGLIREIANNGHEVASHGFWHRLVYEQQRAEFEKDVGDAKKLLEDVAGCEVLGYRAPAFSLSVARTPWAFEALVEQGYLYDAGMFPVRTPIGGEHGGSRGPIRISTHMGPLERIPVATLPGIVRVPVGGGFFVRALPLNFVIHALMRQQQRCAVYVHPWELVENHPPVWRTLRERLSHYCGLSSARSKWIRIWDEIPLTSVANLLRES